MATFCLPPEDSARFLAALKDGTLEPGKLAAMSSEERHALLADIVGEQMAGPVNALLESKLLLKGQKEGLINWAKQVAGLKDPVRRDMISQIERMDRVLNPEDQQSFLADLAKQKIGAAVTMEEANKLSAGVKELGELKAAIPADARIRSDARLAYGLAKVEYSKYLNHLLGKDKGVTLQDFKNRPIWTSFKTISGASKGINASLDMSFFGKQGKKMLLTNPDIWVPAFVKAWGDMAKEVRGIDAMDVIKADVQSRPNAINGKYKAMGADLGIDFEEEFPTSLPEKIPVLGRLYKASETAFNGAALRMRADYADRIIGMAERNGINTLNPDEAAGLGRLVNSMTGRGDIGKLKALGGEINAAVFSIRFLKSNFDTLTMHMADSSMPAATRAFVRKTSAMNLAKIVGGLGAVLATAEMISPGSVEFDPRSAKFGTITLGHTTIDITGGMKGIVTLASRLIVPTKHGDTGGFFGGGWGLWSKSSTTGKWTDLQANKFGVQNGIDVLDNFWQGRLAPITGMIRDYLKGQNYQGQKFTVARAVTSLVTPISGQTAYQAIVGEPDHAAALAAIILDGLGENANPPNAPKTPEDFGDMAPVVASMMSSPGWANMTPDQQAKILGRMKNRLDAKQTRQNKLSGQAP